MIFIIYFIEYMSNYNFKFFKIMFSLPLFFIFFYVNQNIYGTEYTENEWGIKFQVQDPWNITSKPEKDNFCNNELKCLIVLDNTIGDQSSTITILAEKGQEFENKCQCDSLIDFVQYDYNKTFGLSDDFTLISDNETTISGNISAWQLEFDIANPNSNNGLQQEGKMWTILTINNNAYYIIGYTTDKKLYDKYLPEVKKIIGSIEFIPTQEIKKIIQPSFMTSTDLD
jgi:hypothetical protein